MRFTRTLLTCAVGLASCAPALAQSLNTSQIVGTVQDPTGASVPDAIVTLTQTDTGLVRTVKTSSSGTYSVNDLPLGPYKLQVSAPNFQGYTVTGIVLQVGSNPTYDVRLAIGSQTEEVTVQTSGGVQVETVSNGIGQVIDQRQVVELPLNGRDPTQLIALAGATTTAPAGDLNSNKNFPTITIAVAGGLPNGVAYILDGGNHNDVFNNLNLPLPFPDALQEFKSETSSLPAQYGNHASAAINAVTKSGGNAFHGDVFYFVRNYMFNAANFFGYTAPTATAAATKTRDNLKRNQFGGVIGGPIIKDKLFFFGGYQGTIVRSVSAPTQTFTLTQAELNGDFTGCYPTTGAVKLGGPFIGNKTNPANYSQQALNIVKAGIPVLNDPSNPCGSINVRLSQNSTRHDVIGRVDYTINPSQSIFARYLIARYNSPVNVDQSNLLTANQVGQLNQDQALTLGHTWIITPNVVNSLRITGDRTLGLRQLYPFFDPSSVGINAYTNPGLKGFMGITITNGFALGQGGNNPGYFNTVKYQLGDDVTFVRGSHSFALGGQYLFAYMNTVNNRPTNGSYTFAGTVNGGNTAGFADFLTGQVSTFSQGAADYENDRWHYVAFYGQDSWKVTKHLTANYGLRWEPYIPFYNVNSHAENFDIARFNAGQKSSVYTAAPAGLIFPGDAGFPGRSYNNGKISSGFQPRVGFVWDPSHDGTMSVRGGYGLFYDTPQMFFDTRYSNSPPWGQTLSLTNVPLASPFANYPGGNPFPGLLNLNSGTTFVTGGVYVNTPLNLKPMYLQQFNLSVQKQYKSWLFGATYLGNTTTHLTTSYELDPAVYIPGTQNAAKNGCGAMPTSVQATMAVGAACSTTGNTNQRRALYLSNPAQGVFYSTIGQLDDGGHANYNGMLLSVNRRAKLMNLVANYTWSHCLSEAETTELTGPSYIIPGNRAASYSNCDSDRRHVGNVSLILNSPRFQQRFTNAVVGGWGLSTIFTIRSGGYYTVTSGVDNALSGIGAQIATRISNPYTASTRFGASGLITKAAYASAATGTYSLNRPLNTLGPGSYQLDMALTREFPIYEATKVQFRWEVFNVPNEAVFSNPTAALNSNNFGIVTTTAADPRIMQFALKYIF
ncbi:TonB-dependent receptor [Terriglobus roseus]|uniref:Carboxypeptidase regulatory-like domain-containing protein n=1 Tax=Terriglobus roseus TaxID=392734 RepID=A0A1H4NZB0_9BACT|nr:TonB-dependent receptor [Terriglobus roseus]SEC00168.1 Carboxypeptidase regulatory-like domain-containing protein [Terriglobus roseus]